MEILPFNFSFIKEMNWRLNAVIIFLMAAGLLSLSSTSLNFFWRQLAWVILGIILAIIVSSFDWRPFINYRTAIFSIYIITALSLVAVYLFAPTIRGAKSWFVISGLQIQPSEFMKAVLIVLFSLFWGRRHAAIGRVSNLVISFAYFLIPGILIALQPDFGTAILLFCIWMGYLLVSGIKWSHLLILFVILIVAFLVLWNGYLESYQKERIMGFLFPGRDPQGINYNVIQAKIAIGSAGLLGKGYRQGTQSQLGFLPEKQTDFIFAALTEEWGLLFSFLVVGALFFAIYEIIKIGLAAPNNFGRFICLGSVIILVSQFVFNVGSNIGLTPVIGVTFPFLSYGGSSLWTDMILIGIIQSIYIRRSA